LAEKIAPQEVPSRTPWECENPQLRTAGSPTMTTLLMKQQHCSQTTAYTLISSPQPNGPALFSVTHRLMFGYRPCISCVTKIILSSTRNNPIMIGFKMKVGSGNSRPEISFHHFGGLHSSAVEKHGFNLFYKQADQMLQKLTKCRVMPQFCICPLFSAYTSISFLFTTGLPQ